MSPNTERRRTTRYLVALAAALGLGITAWLLWPESTERAAVNPEQTRSREPVSEEPVAEKRAAAPAAQERPAERLEHDESIENAHHEHEPGDPSHPITPDHLRIYRENAYGFAIDNAIQVRDVAAIRRMNAEYRKEFPRDDYVLQDAYDMIADCLEEKTPERVARARKFWQTRRSSRARRDLRRICLE